MTITVFTVFVRMSSYCICCLYPHGLHSLLDLEIKLSIYLFSFYVDLFLSLKKSVDPDEISQYAVFHLGPHCLQK